MRKKNTLSTYFRMNDDKINVIPNKFYYVITTANLAPKKCI